MVSCPPLGVKPEVEVLKPLVLMHGSAELGVVAVVLVILMEVLVMAGFLGVEVLVGGWCS